MNIHLYHNDDEDNHSYYDLSHTEDLQRFLGMLREIREEDPLRILNLTFTEEVFTLVEDEVKVEHIEAFDLENMVWAS